MIRFREFIICVPEEDTEDFLEDFEQLLQKYAEDKWYYNWTEEDDALWREGDEYHS